MTNYKPYNYHRVVQVNKIMQPKAEVIYDYKHHGSDETLTPATVWLRVYFSRTQRKYISTGVRVLPCQWSDEYWVIGRPDAAQLNKMIREQVEKAHKTIGIAIEEKIPMPSTKAMKVDRSDASFIDWLQKEIQNADISELTRNHHKCMLNILQEYGKIKRFEHVTNSNLQGFIRYIANRTVMKPCGPGKFSPEPIKQCTIYGHWKRLKKYIHIAQGKQLIPMHIMQGINVSKGEDAEREYLTDAELKRWIDTKMPLKCLEDARLRFIIQMGTGLAYKDLMEKDFTRCEKVGNHFVLVERRAKTREGFYAVILPFAVKVLRQWKWQVPYITNQDYNKFLERVAVRCNIDKNITSHVARHTYACYCLRHGVRIEAVKRALGHKKLETTQIYARLADMDVLEAFKKSDII